MKRQLFPIVLLSAVFASCASSPEGQKKIDIPQSAAANQGTQLLASDARAIEVQIQHEINVFRAKKKLPALTSSSLLNVGAKQHSQYMKVKAKRANNPLLISHDNFAERADALQSQGSLSSMGENVGVVKGVSKAYVAATLVNGWLDSRGHYKNIVGDYSLTGVGVQIGDDNTVYATQLFGEE